MDVNRRAFLTSVAGIAAVSVTGVSANPTTHPHRSATSQDRMTIQDVIDLVLRDLAVPPVPNTVDVVNVGDPTQQVVGIVTTFLATSAVIRSAANRGANFIISHETLFYNHRDETDWLQEDFVFASKQRLLEDTGMVVWRLHDHWHRHKPDGVTTGVLKRLGWESYASADDVNRCLIPKTSLAELARFLKLELGAASVRFVGDPEMACERVGLLMGAWDSRIQIEYLGWSGVDVLVCGEAREWQTTEYVRDANEAGIPRGLIVVGHASSEEPGMAWFTEWLRTRIVGVEIQHIPTGDPFHYV